MSTHGTLKRVVVEKLGDNSFLITESGVDEVNGDITHYRAAFGNHADAVVQLDALLRFIEPS